MDEYIDELLTQDRVCDTILPRLTQRYILEDSGELENRISPLEDELDEIDDYEKEDEEDGGEDDEVEKEELIPKKILSPPVKISEKQHPLGILILID